MNHTEKLVERLAAAGVEFFDGLPTRSHHRRSGQVRRTVLCYETLRGDLLDTVHWRIPYKGVGYTVELCDTARNLAQAETICLVNDGGDLEVWSSAQVKALGIDYRVAARHTTVV